MNSQPFPSTAVRPLVIAHRGASGLAPENTIAAFRLALALGADGVEMDVHLAADGKPVVIHDARVNRTTNGRGVVSSLSSRELAGLDAGSWFHKRLALRPGVKRIVERVHRNCGNGRFDFAGEPVPTLETVLRFLKRNGTTHVYIELKGTTGTRTALVDSTVDLVRSLRMEPAVTLLSFQPDALARARRLSADLRTAPIFGLRGDLRAWLSSVRDFPHAVALHYSLITARLVRELQGCGLEVATWTANRPIILRRLIARRVDSIVTNFPNRLIALLRDRS